MNNSVINNPHNTLFQATTQYQKEIHCEAIEEASIDKARKTI